MSRQYTLHAARSTSIHIDYAAELNEQQLAAVTAKPGPQLIIAGAGSGKTRTLTYRVAYLLENGIDPRNILLLTFTNKAARQMLDRVANLLPIDASGIWGGTFHSVGNRMLRRHGNALGLNSGFTIMDREDQKDLINTVVASAGIDPKEIRFPKGDVLAEIFSFVVNTETPMEELLALKFPYFLPLLEKITDVHARYEKKKKATNSVDFDDLLEKTLTMLQKHENIASFYRRQFQFILVDEYQDTNKIQADFIDLLACENRNVMVVGDDAQSIYSWRGANFQNILEFPKRYPDAQVFKIEMNYRSVPEVLEVANAAISANVDQFKKNLQPVRESNSAKPAIVALNDGNEQAQFIAQRILELRDEDVDLNEIAVLYRAHYHALELQLELSRRGIPYQITSGIRFFEQAHIKDVISFLRFVSNPRDEVAFKRMVKLLPGIGNRSAENLWSAWDKSLNERGEITSWSERLMAMSVGAKSKKHWTQLALISNVDAEAAPNQTADKEAVNLSTVHQAKGLEFHTVFVIWLTDGMFPSSRSMDDRKDLEEERRLFYVAITRAKDELYLTYPHMRLTGGYGDVFQRPSRFLREVPNKLVEDWQVQRG